MLVVGAGPAGLEAARDARAGAATRSCSPRPATSSAAASRSRRACRAWPPGSASSTTARSQLARLPNVEVGARQPRSTGRGGFATASTTSPFATGARWRGDGVGRWHTRPLEIGPGVQVLTPDDLLAGARPDGERVVVFDDDHYYMGGVLAELLAREGREVTLVTPGAAGLGVDGRTRWSRTASSAGCSSSASRCVVSRALVPAGAGGRRRACVFTDARAGASRATRSCS